MHLPTVALLTGLLGLASAAGTGDADTAVAAPTGSSSSSSSSSSTASEPHCDAQSIVDACLLTMKAQLEDCPANKWDCLCEQTNNVLTCYNNCPYASARSSVAQQADSYCNAAEANSRLYSTSSATKTASKPTKTDTPPATTTSMEAFTGAATGGAAMVAGGRVGVGEMMLLALGWGVLGLN